MPRPRRSPLPPGIHERRYASGRTALWIDFRDANGERVQELGGATLAEAARKLARRRAEVAAGTFTRAGGSSEQTLATWAAKVFEARRGEGVRSVDREEQIFRDHIEPELGAARLSAIRPKHVAAWIQTLVVAGELSPKSILNAHGVLTVVLGRARFDELVDDNAAKSLPRGKLPKNTRTRVVGAWTREEIARWITPHVDVPEDRSVAYAIATFTGARVGEIAGMRLRDLDRAARPLWRWALRTQYDGEPLKTDNPRDVPIHAELQRILEAWLADGWARFKRRHPTPDDFVIPRAEPIELADGRMTEVHSKSSLGAKAVHRHATPLGLSSTGRDFHSFRRAMITLARTDGAREDVLERITHNAAGTMIDGYTYFGWDSLCDAITCMRVRRLELAPVVALPRAVGGDARGDAAGGMVAKASIFNAGEMEAPGVEAGSRSGHARSEADGAGGAVSLGRPVRRGSPRGADVVPVAVTRVTTSPADLVREAIELLERAGRRDLADVVRDLARQR